MAISHSPPVDILRNFDKGLTEADLRSPNLVRFPSSAVSLVQQDQLPYHILIRNIQAQIAKCCRWNVGDGSPGEFYLTPILDGSVTAQITDANGNLAHFKGIAVTHDEFPDSVGTFFPVGTVVVAGFKDQPSFYLEPKTGLPTPGEGIIFDSGGANSPSNQAKNLAVQASQPNIDAVNTANFASSTADQNLAQAQDFYDKALETKNPATIEAAKTKRDTAQDKADAAQAAATAAQTLGNEANVLIGEVQAATVAQEVFKKSQDLADTLDDLADQVEIAGNNAGGAGSSESAAAQASILRILARDLRFVGFGGASKCEFFFETTNLAELWNSPQDGSLPCNGVRTDCEFYTGESWQLATDEKMEIGQPITGDQLQEVRFRSDDWSRFTAPDTEFETRFSTPFIWAFKGYTDIVGEPRIEDMLLYQPKVLFGRETSDAEYETLLLEKIQIVDFDDFELSKQKWRVQPGSHTLDIGKVPDYPTVIADPNVPSNIRLKITHPQDSPFVYRTWSPDKNVISLFGTGAPNATIYIVNDTALHHRLRYHNFLGTKDIKDIPSGLPGAPNFNGVAAAELRAIFSELEEEQILNTSDAPLGFHKTTIGRDGSWSSINTVDLVHNEENSVYVFLLIDDVQFIFDSTIIDYRFLHAIIKQTHFTATDFSMNDSIESVGTGAITANVVNGAKIQANMEQVVGRENVSLDQMYFGWRFKDRNLSASTLQQPSDLQGAGSVADVDAVAGLVVAESDADAFITRVGYNVVQYRKEITLNFEDWYLIDDCGTLMLVFDDTDLHRVLPLPDSTGSQTALTDVLVNGGGTGSIIAQWALEEVVLDIPGAGLKQLGQVYRNPDGVGLPANYVIVGPKPGSDEENAFGRPTASDVVRATVTFLRPQTAGLASNDPQQSEPELSEEVVKDNFNDDTLLFTTNISSISGDFFTAGQDSRSDDIQADQQDYVFIINDSDGRPIGRKITRFMVTYYNLGVIPVEIGYQWRGACTTYALFPDLSLAVGGRDGQVTVQPKGISSPDEAELELGFRVADLIGEKPCVQTPSCGDHEFISLGPLRVEVETVLYTREFPGGKAYYPSAGQAVPSDFISRSDLRPGSQFLKKRGPLWYPYDVCERPRYNFKTGGPMNTDSTELINTEVKPAGLGSDSGEGGGSGGSSDTSAVGTTGSSGPPPIMEDSQAQASAGEFGGLPPASTEAYRGPDMVVPKILDIHPSLRPCTSAYTYGNQILTGGQAEFSGYARERAEVALFWYEGSVGAWTPPPFGNLGRNQLLVDVAEKRGDFLGGLRGGQTGFRWMPMYPEREDLGANIELWGEELEPQHCRLICESTPVGAINEGAPTRSSARYTHKALIFNRALATIEYPYAPYYPTFLPDADLGKEPEERGSDLAEGDQGGNLTTMWAWREQEKAIRRGVGSDVVEGIQLQSPEYFIDNRRLEIKMRPDEGSHTIKYTSPRYDEAGEIIRNASFQLDSGPPRYIKVDFVNRDIVFELSQNPGETVDSFYDTSKGLGEGLFTCTEGVSTDNLSLNAECTCEIDTTDENLDAQNLPARFLHLDELAPDNFLALYESDTIQTPFAIDIPREEANDPCCMCLYYIRGIFIELNNEYLPINRDINLARDSRFTAGQSFKYTWSRVPHGFEGGSADDGRFQSVENQADQYLHFDDGEVFVNQFEDGARRLNVAAGTAAFFPSEQYAQDNSIFVTAPLGPGDPKLKGGNPANDDGESQGQPEAITLDMVFDTYVRIKQINIKFVAGAGFEVPPVVLRVVDPANRTGASVTTRAAREIAVSALTAQGTNLVNASNFSSADIQNGEVLFPVNILPSYTDVPFWNQFGQEFHLIFEARTGDYSMGIASIDVIADTFLPDFEVTENITVYERKYYVSKGSPVVGNNPESFLGEADSATGYWRTTEVAATTGANRHRAYGFGRKLSEDGGLQRGGVQGLEKLQEEKYDEARDLMPRPYIWTFRSFSPLDEAEAIDFYQGSFPDWVCTLYLKPNRIDEVSRHDSGNLLFGKVPQRNPWSAPGHAWTFNMVENYVFCCFPCPKTMVVDYNYAHLHDGLAIVETARFWDEMPSGFTRLIRSTMLAPDPTFGQSQQAGVGLDGGSTTGPVLLDESLFVDSQGASIDASTLENAGFRVDPSGNLVILETGGE
jgi:hypothetical protein